MKCAYCHDEIPESEIDENGIQCSNCRAWQHLECWDDNKGCATFGCRHHKIRRPFIIESLPYFAVLMLAGLFLGPYVIGLHQNVQQLTKDVVDFERRESFLEDEIFNWKEKYRVASGGKDYYVKPGDAMPEAKPGDVIWFKDGTYTPFKPPEDCKACSTFQTDSDRNGYWLTSDGQRLYQIDGKWQVEPSLFFEENVDAYTTLSSWKRGQVPQIVIDENGRVKRIIEGKSVGKDYPDDDYTITYWQPKPGVKPKFFELPNKERWNHIGMVQKDGKIIHYLNGERQP